MSAKETRGVQEALVRFLSNPKSYPHRTRKVRLVTTHASHVFLAAPFVYKIKRPVNLGFLDFSTLERRKHFCERELILNQRLAPEVYLDVVPIFRTSRSFAFDGGTEIVEYAVKMRKLSDGHFLDQITARGEVSREHLDRVVAALEGMYREQDRREEIEQWGSLDRLRLSTDENFRQIRQFVWSSPRAKSDARKPGTLSRAALDTLEFYTQLFYERHAKLFASRIRGGWIRDCHGDLHLEHIHITPKAVNIYDCIEFNDRLRYVDVANDAAFLAMDLDHEGRPDLAGYFALRMATVMGDDEMLSLMDFYKCYRAVVRGKVESLQATSQARGSRELAERARRYFQLALGYTVAGSRPLVLVVMGGIAAGKSTLANALGEELGWQVYSSDRLRKELAGVPLYARSGASQRQRLYTRAMTRKTYSALCERAVAQARGGNSVIVEARFARAEQRARLRRRLDPLGISWCVLELRASPTSVERRLTSRAKDDRAVSDARLEDLAGLSEEYEPPVELDSRQRLLVESGGVLDETLGQALRRLASRRIALSE